MTPDLAGFIGLGEQGQPIALNLQNAGHPLIVFDARAEALKPLADAGAQIAGSVEEVGRQASRVFVCVADDPQLEAVLLGPAGLMQCMPAGGLIIVHSTVSRGLVCRAAEHAEKAGLMLIDAPLTGGPEGARSKRVVYFVGAEPEAFERCRPLLEVSARKIVQAGPVGAGVQAKLVHQLVLCGNLIAAREGWLLGREAGLDDAVILDVLQSGAAQSFIAERWSKLPWTEHIKWLLEKDLSLCIELGDALGMDLSVARFVRQGVRSQEA